MKGVRVVDPNDELVLDANTIRFNYRGFPLTNRELRLKNVYLKDTEFHFKTFPVGSNITFITEYFKSDTPKDSLRKPFRVNVQHFEMDNVTFSLENRRRGVGEVDSNRVNARDMYFSSIYSVMENIQVIKDSIKVDIEYLRTKEKSGLELKTMQMEAIVSPNGIMAKNAVIETGDSKLMFDAALKYHTWKGMKEYVKNVWMDVEFREGTYGSMKDAEYWAHSIVGSDVKAYFSGDFHGTVSDFETELFKIQIGNGTLLQFGGKVAGLPKVRESKFDVNVELLSASLDDFNKLKFPEKWNIPVIPQQFTKEGSVSLKAALAGTFNDFISTLSLQSNIGNADMHIVMNSDKETKEQEYTAEVNTTYLNLMPVLSSEWIQGAELHAKITGNGLFDDNMKASIEANIDNLTVKNYAYDSISVNGDFTLKSFSGNVHVIDNNIGLIFEGLADIGNGKYDFDIRIDDANIAPLNLGISENLLSGISTKINANLSGKDINEIVGTISIDSTLLRRNIREILQDEILITLEENKAALNSDFLDFSLEGNFSLKDMNNVIDKFVYTYVPQYTPSPYIFEKDTIQSDFKFEGTIKDVSNLSYLFDDKFNVANNSIIKGRYTEENSLELLLKSDNIRFGELTIEDMEIHTRQMDSIYDISFHTPFIYVSNLILTRNTAINLQSNSSVIDIDIWWDDKTDSLNRGEIHTRGNVAPKKFDFKFLSSYMIIQGSQWNINQNHKIAVNNGDFLIDNLVLQGNTQKIEVNAEMSDDAGNEVIVGIENFELNRLNFFMEKRNILLDGIASGNFTLNRAEQSSHFRINFDITDFAVNEEKLGNATVKSTWDDRNERLRLQFESVLAESVPVYLSGYYYPSREKNNLDFDLKFQSFPLKATSRFIESIASDVRGSADGTIKLTGQLSAPVAKGELSLHSGSLLIRYLNTRYHLDDKIYLAENVIDFKNFQITDTLDNNAFINGKITHSGFKDFKFDLGISSDNFLFMNTNASSGQSYYGTILASATATVKGNVNHLDLNINARSEKGTNLTIPVINRTNLEAQKYIHFVTSSDSTTGLKTQEEPLRAGLSYNMTINLYATPDAKIALPMSFGQFGGEISASGSGNLRLGISSREGFSIFGTYTLNSGTFQMQLINLVSKDFTIQDGGTIQWTGDPLNGIVDIKAIYPLKANLEPLFKDQTTIMFGDVSQNYRKRVDVHSIVNMKGQLTDPQVQFDIDFPYMDATTQEMVYSVLDKTDERIVLEQTMSLLFLGIFYSSGITPTDELIRDGISGGINALTSQVGSIISNITGLNIGLEYESSDNYTTERWNVNISEEWNRFYIEGRLGFGGTERTEQAENASNFIGDILVGYRISSHWSLTAFNRSNVNDFTKPYSPYTQGVGVSYKKDFDTLKELFTSQRRKKKKELEAKKEEENVEKTEQETNNQ